MICVPIAIPVFAYTMNGVTLDTPIRAIGPILQGGNVLVGTPFALVFQSASSQTLTALANGVTGTMTFAAHDGSAVSGLVKVASSSSGSLFFVTCAVLVTVAVSHAVIVTQFY